MQVINHSGQPWWQANHASEIISAPQGVSSKPICKLVQHAELYVTEHIILIPLLLAAFN